MSQSWRIQENNPDRTAPVYPVTVTVSVPKAPEQPDSRPMERRLGNYSPVDYRVTTNPPVDGATFKTELILNRTPQKFVIDQPGVPCQRCKRDINLTNDSEIRFKNRAYHPDCFKCTRCHRNLSDTPKTNFAVHHDGEPLCLQCETELADVCVSCKRPIVGEKSLSFDGKKYHAHCFQCGQCFKALLDEKESYVHDSKPCCSECFRKDFAPRCAECLGPITVGKATVYDSKKYHPQCFRCGQCHKLMVEREFVSRDSKPCCNACYNDRFAERCAECQKLIADGKSTICNNKAYHPDCFRCGQCHKPIVDREFFLNDSKPCCSACYNDRFAERCAECQKLIATGEATLYDTKKYHPECFRCGQCHKPIVEREFHSRDSKPCCNACYNDRFAERCAECQKLITTGEATLYDTKKYHPECFRCGQCHKPIVEREFVSRDSKPCCNACYKDRFAERCAECQKLIADGKSTICNNKAYHPDCFRCGQCHKPIVDREFFLNDSKPCCSDCYRKDVAPRCAECSGPITVGKSTIYDSKKYHPECFRCGQCHKPMVEKEFYSRDSKPCCMPCYNDRFAERCAECQQLITNGKSTIFNNKAYHPDCLRCGQCRKVMGDEKKCFTHESKPCCNQCYTDRVAPRCGKCLKPILDRSRVFQGKEYHLDCFVCANCNRVIGSSEKFVEDTRGFICTRCRV